MGLWNWLLDPSGLTAHGFCLNWAPGLLGLHLVSDALIGLAYFSIPLALASFARQRPDLEYRWAIYLFMAFIVACGTTHLFSILTVWSPVYGLEGIVKLVTAVLSVTTAAVLWPLIPKMAALPSPAQLENANDRLFATVAELRHTAELLKLSDARSRAANLELERRVAGQTAQLMAANDQLTAALADRNLVMETLASSEEIFRASFDGAAVGKSQSDPFSAHILRVNKAFANMLGYEPNDIVGRIVWDLVGPDERAGGMAQYAQLISGEIPSYVQERRYQHRTGALIWCRVSTSLVRSSISGEPKVVVAVIEDIDERHKAVDALEQAKAELEMMVDERTLALRQRDILLREVYHRVKNNLQIIDSFLVMQGRQLRDPDARAALLSLRNRVYALGLVHHQLMESTNLRTFDIAPFLAELSDNIIKGGGDRKINLLVQASPMDVGLDFAIPLGLLVTELVTNALKHAFAGQTGTIEVTLERAENGDVTLVVSDDGRGLGDAPRSTGARAGLGTSIIAGLVAQMRGTLTMQSDRGTRAEVRLAAPVVS